MPSPMPSKTRPELVAENRLLRKQRIAESWALVLMALFKWGCFAYLGYCGYRSVAALAGTSTAADIVVAFIGEVKSGGKGLAWLLGALGILYGLLERGLRRKTIDRLGSRVKELEAAIDPRRTSSGLTTTGETHPEDRP